MTNSYDSDFIISEKAKPLPKEVWKPDSSTLADAIVDGKLLVSPGDDILIEYPQKWRESVVWRVCLVYDDSAPTEEVEIFVRDGSDMKIHKRTVVAGTTCPVGYMRLWDMTKCQYGSMNYKTAAECQIKIKIWAKAAPK